MGRLAPQRDSRFGVPRAGPGGGRERDAKSRHLLSPNEAMELASRGLVLGGAGEAGRQIYALVEPQRDARLAGWSWGGSVTPNLGTC